MTIRKKKPYHHTHEIDLTGPEGNAYCLLGYAEDYCKQLKWYHEPIIEEMKSGDYEHLVKVFDKHFGHFVTLYR